MGADLYLNSVFRKIRDKYAPKFEHWVAKRNALQKTGQYEAADEADKQATKYFDKMYERGYFRDDYDNSNLLWMLDLSWWEDVQQMFVDEEGKMSAANAVRFLQMLADREPVLEANLELVKPPKDVTMAEIKEYFHDKYERLKAFLQQAIDGEEDIQCAI